MEAEIKFEGIFTGTNFPFSISNLAFPLPTFYWPSEKLASSSRIRIIPLVSLYMDALAVTCCFYMKVLNPCQTASSHWIKKDKSFLLKFEIKTVGWCVCVCVLEDGDFLMSDTGFSYKHTSKEKSASQLALMFSYTWLLTKMIQKMLLNCGAQTRTWGTGDSTLSNPLGFLCRAQGVVVHLKRFPSIKTCREKYRKTWL